MFPAFKSWNTPGLSFWISFLFYLYLLPRLFLPDNGFTIYMLMAPEYLSLAQVFPLNSRFTHSVAWCSYCMSGRRLILNMFKTESWYPSQAPAKLTSIAFVRWQIMPFFQLPRPKSSVISWLLSYTSPMMPIIFLISSSITLLSFSQPASCVLLTLLMWSCLKAFAFEIHSAYKRSSSR